jgi:hypothetical protein
MNARNRPEKRHRAEFGECLLLGFELSLLPDPALPLKAHLSLFNRFTETCNDILSNIKKK